MATPFSMPAVAGEAIPANYVVHIDCDTGIATKAYGDLASLRVGHSGFLYGFTQIAVAEDDVFNAQLIGFFKPQGLTVFGDVPTRVAYLPVEIANAGLVTDIPPTTGPAILQELGKLFVKDSELWCYFNPTLRVLIVSGA